MWFRFTTSKKNSTQTHKSLGNNTQLHIFHMFVYKNIQDKYCPDEYINTRFTHTVFEKMENTPKHDRHISMNTCNGMHVVIQFS